jgi:hypothetical protein
MVYLQNFIKLVEVIYKTGQVKWFKDTLAIAIPTSKPKLGAFNSE